MKEHGKALAALHKLGLERAPDQLLARLAENEDVLIGACNLLTEAVKANRRIAPAGEWVLDNFYLIEEEIRTARRHLRTEGSWSGILRATRIARSAATSPPPIRTCGLPRSLPWSLCFIWRFPGRRHKPLLRPY